MFYWLAGSAAALAGVLLVRLLPAQPPPYLRPIASMAGYGLAFLGLLLIAKGLRKKGSP